MSEMADGLKDRRIDLLFNPEKDNGVITTLKDTLDEAVEEYRNTSNIFMKKMKKISVKHGIKKIKKVLEQIHSLNNIPASLLAEYRYYLYITYGSNYRSCLRMISDNSISFRVRINKESYIIGIFTLIKQKDESKFTVNSRYMYMVNSESMPYNLSDSFLESLPIYQSSLDKAIDNWYYSTSLSTDIKIDIIKSLIHKEILEDIYHFMAEMVNRAERAINL